MVRFMKILYIVNGLFYHGAENFAFKLSKGVSGNHLKIFLLSINKFISEKERKIIKKELESKGIQVFEINRRARKDFLKTFFIIHNIYKKVKFDIIHVHGDGITNLAGLFFYIIEILTFPWTKKSKKIITHHSASLENHRYFFRILSKITKNIYNKHVFLYDKQINRYKLNLEKKNVIVIGNAIENKFFINRQPKNLKSKNSINIINISRFDKIKNHEFFIDLVNYLDNNNNLLRYILNFKLIGVGPRMGLIKNKLKVINRLDMFKFYKNVLPKKIISLLDESDLFLLPSLSEAAPTVIFESFARGVPVITRKFDIFDNNKSFKNTGFFLDDFSPKNFLNTINRIITNPSLYKKLSKKCIKVSYKFKPEKVFNSHIFLYKKIMNE